MSLISKVETKIEDKLLNFVSEVSNKYNIKTEDITSLWDVKETNINIDRKILRKNNITELKKMCKDRKIKCPAGTKKEKIIDLLLSYKKPDKNKIQENKTIINVKRNEYGNYMHGPTHFVFHPKTKQVIGKQNGKEVDELTKKNIEICKELNFDFLVPFNLDEDTDNLNNEKVEELDIEECEDYESNLIVISSDDEMEENVE